MSRTVYDSQKRTCMAFLILMLGLAAGRIISLILDGFPHPLLFTYLVLEVIMGVVALIFLGKTDSAHKAS